MANTTGSHLEAQLLEKPFVLAGLVALFELCPDCEACLLLLHGVFQNLLVEVSLVEADIDGVTSGHQVVVVDDLKEIMESKIKFQVHGKIRLITLTKEGRSA